MQVYWDVHIVYEVSNKVKWMKATDTEMENLTWYPIDGKTRSLWNLTFKENKGQDKMNISSLFLIDNDGNNKIRACSHNLHFGDII